MRWEAVWRRSSAWGHGYLIPVIAVLIAHFRLKELNPQRIGPCAWGLGLVLAGLVVRIWSQTLMYGFPGELTFLPVVGGVVLLVLGWQMFKVLWIPVAYLGLMIPWDTKYYEGIALPLQTLSAAATGKFLVLVGYEPVPADALAAWLRIPHGVDRWVCREGNVMHLASGPVNVAEACSGLHLLFAFVALGVMMAYMYRRALWERLLIMGSSVPIAIFCNFIRVALMALSSDSLYFERAAAMAGAPTWSKYVPGFFWDVLSGAGVADKLAALRESVMNPDSWLHLSFGFLMLGLAFLLMSMELRLIDLLLVEDDRPHAGGPSPPVEPDAGASGYVRT
jgi:exosortase